MNIIVSMSKRIVGFWNIPYAVSGRNDRRGRISVFSWIMERSDVGRRFRKGKDDRGNAGEWKRAGNIPSYIPP
jgi:hypothetical protein